MKTFAAVLAVSVATLVAPAPAVAAPKPCIAALDASERLTELLGSFTEAVSGHITELDKAADGRHVEDDMTAAIVHLGDRAAALTGQIKTTVKQYKHAAARCRAS